MRGLDALYEDVFDRRVLRPLHESGVRKLSLSCAAKTWERIDRLADRNEWSVSATVAVLLQHALDDLDR